MESLRNTHKILMKERTSAIRRGLLDTIDSRARLIAIKGIRCGEDQFPTRLLQGSLQGRSFLSLCEHQ